jgi:predicted DNA-binding transcriptional regulator YafY
VAEKFDFFMPVSKNAPLRYRLIDECLCRDKVRWTRARLLAEVADKFLELTGQDISPRQIDMDIKAMKLGGDSGLDAPIEFDRKAGYYRYTEPGYSIRNSPLMVDDAEVLRQALTVLQQFQGLGLSEALNALVSRVEKQVNLHGRPPEAVSLQFEQVPDYTGADKLRPLYEAIRFQQVLRLSYQPFNSTEAKPVTVHPYLLKEFNHRWFLLAYNQEQECLSNYALDRIMLLTPTDEIYQLAHRPDAAVYFQHVIGPSVSQNGVVEEVKLRFNKSRAPYVVTKPIHSSQRTLLLEDGGMEVTLQLMPNRELESLLLSFGSDVTVLAPATLRQKMADSHRLSLTAYSPSLVNLVADINK